ncbi:hypothetical protein ACTOB_003060 [Actinoplanes oblitus]|uniref:Uncharacterized protein n=1 Tax=Actinoplanes oblitus TaxID=3040509 RepID=A0ABY8WNF2_9ACTN|nr:hypothetical protein [Actinoplanes oblitus]WIM99409.1 hypothetical protein ACTOB_003060 [Actinoplanes oblitus]
MPELSLPPLDQQPITLVPEPLDVRGPGDPAPGELAGRLFLGGPLAVPLTGGADGFAYRLTHLALTVIADDDAPFESVTLGVELTCDAGEAIAWSMAPDRVTDTAQLTDRFRFGPQLSLLGVEASLGSVERTRVRQGTELLVEALRPLRADPAWVIRRGRHTPAAGAYRFVMVVRSPAGGTVRTGITVTARVRRRRLFGYRTSEPVMVDLL